jgi:hypothetical protein
VTYARNISTWRSILFPYLHSRLTRHAGNKAYTTYEKLVQLIEKSRGLTDGNVRRYEYQLVRSPLEAETDLDEFYPSCDFGDCPSRFESHKQPKLCSRYDCHLYFRCTPQTRSCQMPRCDLLQCSMSIRRLARTQSHVCAVYITTRGILHLGSGT